MIGAVLSLILFPTPFLVEVGMLKGATNMVGQEEAEKIEKKLGME